MATEAEVSKKTFSINRMIILFITGGYLFLFVETLVEHQDVLPHETPAFIPIFISLIGFTIAMLTVQSWKDNLIKLLHVYLFLTMLVGFGGMIFHNKERFTRDKDENETTMEKETHDVKPPMLAPAAFIGLGALGLLGTSRKREAEIKN